MSLNDIGLIGLSVMGQNLALNIAQNGFKIAVYNRTVSKTEDTIARSKEEGLEKWVFGYKDLKQFIQSLSKPRKVIILVQAGKPVDLVLKGLRPLMESNDIIIDGGNEWYKYSERRSEECKEFGIRYMAMGVSGGELGARYGPSLMPGGPKDAYDELEDLLVKVSAKVNNEPCVTYIGRGGSGNYTKMLHNGVEYADMQNICETYDMLRHHCGLDNDKIASIFEEWNSGELDSFLIEITSQICRKKDYYNPSEYLMDKIVDSSGSKGTGRMTVQDACERMGSVPTIFAALDARYMSSFIDERKFASTKLQGPKTNVLKDPKEIDRFVEDLKNALYCAKICCYAQGFNLLQLASDEFDWDLQLPNIAQIWRGGCIIRAKFLDRITNAYKANPKLSSLLLDKDFMQDIQERQASWRRVIITGIENGIPLPGLSSSLSYYDSYRRNRVTANLIQAQRDYFGAHTYKRWDQTGVYHTTDWQDPSPSKAPEIISKL